MRRVFPQDKKENTVKSQRIKSQTYDKNSDSKSSRTEKRVVAIDGDLMTCKWV